MPVRIALAVRGESLALHRDERGASRARHDDREYRLYLMEEQRRPRGCIARRMQTDFHHGLLGINIGQESCISRTGSSSSINRRMASSRRSENRRRPRMNGATTYSRHSRRTSLILLIVDECHSGSARDEGAWRAILDHFEPAYQLGMTATRLRGHSRDSHEYFGNPLYTYNLRQGIEDAFLAPYRVHRVITRTGRGRLAPQLRRIGSVWAGDSLDGGEEAA